MSFSLTMVNLWVGLCRGVAGLPTDLKKLGYQDRWIEYPFSNQDLEPVSPDLVVASEQMKHTLLLEWKSGANTEADQLRRYSRVTEQNLRQVAFVRREAARTHDVTLVGRREHAERLQIGIEEGGYGFPLLVADDRALTLSHNEFRISPLTQLFSPGLMIDFDKIPTRFVPFDADSDLWEVAEVVVPKILQYMAERSPRTTSQEICAAICNTWSIMGRPAKDGFMARVRAVLEEAARTDFRAYWSYSRAGRGSIEIVANPLDLEPDKRTAAYRRLRTLQSKFIERLKRGGSNAMQLGLNLA